RVADGGERSRIPAGPDSDALRHLVREGEVEILGAESGPGDPRDLLQYPRADIGVGRGPGSDRLPRPAEPYVRQVHVDPDQVQGRAQRGQRRQDDRLAEYQPRHDQDRGPFELARNTQPSPPFRPERHRPGLAWPPWRRLRPGREIPHGVLLR